MLINNPFKIHLLLLGSAIATKFTETLHHFEIREKFGKTTDGGSNVVRAAENCEAIQRLYCLGHLYHLVVCHGSGIWKKVALRIENESGSESDDEDDNDEEWAINVDIVDSSTPAEEITDKVGATCASVRKLVSFFRRSSRAGEVLREVSSNSENDFFTGILPIDVKTRWSSTYKMLTVVVKNINWIETALNTLIDESSIQSEKRRLSDLYLSRENIFLLKEIIPVLEMFKLATEMLSGREYSTANLAYITLFGLKRSLEQTESSTSADQENFKQSLLKQLLRYTWNCDNFNILFFKTAAFLDNNLLTSNRFNLGAGELFNE